MVKGKQDGLVRTLFQPEQVNAIVLLAHGAGAGNQHPFMQQMAQELALFNIEVVSLNFPYMKLMYELDKKRPPNSNNQLVAHFEQELEQLTTRNLPVFVAGKSMGGRVASQLAADPKWKDSLKGAIVFGYPFIPPGKPEKYQQRVEHFSQLQVPLLICQGERDTFGNRSLLEANALPARVQLEWIASGDHSYKPLKSSGLTDSDNIKHAARLSAEFISGLI